MSIHLYRYGESGKLPGLSIGVTRQAPRGVRREERAERGYFDLWLPMLGPSRELLHDYKKERISFAEFSTRYRAEMKRSEPGQVIALLAAMAKSRRINLGCFCPDPAKCHRSLLRELIAAELPGSEEPASNEEGSGCASPPCSMAEFEDQFFG